MNLPDINKYHLNYWIDMSLGLNAIWKPVIDYVDGVSTEIITNEIYLDSSGS